MNSEERAEFARLYDDSADRIGDYGEVLTASTLRNQCNMRVLRTLYIGRSQIDMVGISEYGLFVVENKNYHGFVTGNYMDKYWNVWYSRYKRHKLYNPCWQNEEHARVVQEMLELRGITDVPIYKPVIFNDLVGLLLKGTDSVFILRDFSHWYANSELESKLSTERIEQVEQLLRGYQDSSEEAKERHVARINEKRDI